MQDITDTELIAQTLSGDTEAYAELIDRYKNAVYYHCFAIVRDEDAAEDIAQDTFITAYYKLEQYNSDYKLATWLFKISTNKCLAHLKRHKRQVPLDDEHTSSLASTQPSPHAEAVQSELHDAVQRLRPQYRVVISLYYWQGLDYVATAGAMNVPLNTVRVWLKRAKEELKKELS